MADPLSTASGIIAVLQLTSTVVRYLNEAKGAAEDRRRVLNELSSAIGLLYMLKDTAEQLQQEQRPITTISALSGPNGPLQQFKSALEELALQLSPARGLKRATKSLSWPFSKSEINAILERMERQKSMFALALENDHIQLTQKLKESVSEVQFNLHSVIGDVQEIMRAKTDTTNRELLDWLSPINSWAKHIDVSEKRQAGTGQWVLETSEFREWMEGATRTLWCPGVPGAGKTVLASFIIDHIQQQFIVPNAGIAYVYCSYQDNDQKAHSLIASLLKQLAGQLPTMPREINELFKQHSNRQTRPRSAELLGNLQSLIRKFSKAFVIVDALDECSESMGTRYEFVEALKALPDSTHLLFTSRPISSIGADLSPCACLQITARNQDLCVYLESKIQAERRLRVHVNANPTLKHTIINAIVDKAQGMFLLAQLHIALLARKPSRKEMLATLHLLPQELNKTYEEAMYRIRDQAEEDASLANQILLWVLRAYRPIKLPELQHSLAVLPDQSELDESAVIDENVLLSVCAGLVTVEKESNTVCLVHYTAKQYFETALQGSISDGHAHIATTCLTYLLLDDFAEDLGGSSKLLGIENKTFPLLPYAACYWGSHLQQAYGNELGALAMRLLEDQTKLESACRYFYLWKRQEWVRQFNGLHVTAMFGLTELSKIILRAQDIDINQQNDAGETPLSIACRNGALGLVDMFLAVKGIDINAGRDTNSGTALHSAAAFGDVGLVSKLLYHGADIHALTERLLTALHVAAESGHVCIVELLLQAGSDIKALTQSGTTPLYRSIRSGNIDVLRTILHHDQNVNVSTWDSWTPLHEAAECNQSAMAKCLLDHGADASICTLDGLTALDIAQMLKNNNLADLLFAAQQDQQNEHDLELVDRSPVHRSVPKDARILQDFSAESLMKSPEERNQDQTQVSRISGVGNPYPSSGDIFVSNWRSSAGLTAVNGRQYPDYQEEERSRRNLGTAISADQVGGAVCDTIRAELSHRFPRLDSKLVHRIATYQAGTFVRLTFSRQEHAGRVSGQGCPAGLLCLGSSEALALLSELFDDPGRRNRSELSGVEPLTPHEAVLGGSSRDIPHGPGDLPREFECPLCFEIVNNSTNLQWAHHIHQDFRSFACIEVDCDISVPFGIRREWVRHDRMRHDRMRRHGRNLYQWKCKDCPYQSLRKGNLTQHRRVKHAAHTPNSHNPTADPLEQCSVLVMKSRFSK